MLYFKLYPQFPLSHPHTPNSQEGVKNTKIQADLHITELIEKTILTHGSIAPTEQ